MRYAAARGIWMALNRDLADAVRAPGLGRRDPDTGFLCCEDVHGLQP